MPNTIHEHRPESGKIVVLKLLMIPNWGKYIRTPTDNEHETRKSPNVTSIFSWLNRSFFLYSFCVVNQMISQCVDLRIREGERGRRISQFSASFLNHRVITFPLGKTSPFSPFGMNRWEVLRRKESEVERFSHKIYHAAHHKPGWSSHKT